MRKVKRALAAVLAVLMAGSLSACGVNVQTKDDANTTAAVTEAEEETTAGGEGPGMTEAGSEAETPAETEAQ